MGTERNTGKFERPATGKFARVSTGTSGSFRRVEREPARLVPWLRGQGRAFADMDESDVSRLLADAEVRRYSRDVVVQAQNAHADRMYVVIEGTLAIRVRSGGVVREVMSFGPAEIAGLLAFLDPQPAPYEIVAATDCEVICVDVDRLSQYRAALHPDGVLLSQALLGPLTSHLRALDERAVKLAVRKSAVTAGSGETFRRDER
jgi:CRP-like cAMP-binding protein